MAINLWKIGGKPTSYNPLPASAPSAYFGLGDYIVSFKAKSASGGQLRVTNWIITTTINQVVTLTSDFKTYSFSFKQPVAQSLVFYDVDAKNDIIITDIQLVQKPLPKLTINGIDGFKSGKWAGNVATSNVTFIDDTTVSFLPTAQYGTVAMNTGDPIPCLPNTTYTYSASQVDGNGAFLGVFFLGSNKAQLSSNNAGNNVLSYSFTTPSNCYFIQPTVQSRAVSAWNTVTAKNLMLNLGTIPAPYSKKTSADAKMVMPTPKGNLYQSIQGKIVGRNFNSVGGIWNGATASSTRGMNDYLMPIKPNTTYTMTWDKDGYALAFHGVDSSGIVRYDSNWQTSKSFTFTTPSNVTQFYVYFRINPDGSALSLTDISSMLIQITEGTLPTPYKQYAVQMNKKPGRYVPKKNLVPSFKDSRWTIPANVVVNNDYSVTGSDPSSSSKTPWVSIKVESGKTYNFSCLGTVHLFKTSITLYDGAKIISSPFTVDSSFSGYVTVRPISNEFSYPQLEEGTTATSFEPFTPILPRAKTGVSMNGVTDYFQLPSMTMDSIEIDCLIDSVQQGNYYLLDARTGLANSWVASNDYNVGGVTSFASNGVVLPTINPGASIPKNQRIKLKATFVSAFTDDVTIFGRYIPTATNYTKGTLYKVTCYLGNAIVAQYDFENPGNIVGSTVFNGKAKNLIPSFEDARWSLHANTQVLGKDVLRLNANSLYQESNVTFDVKPNTTYLATMVQGFSSSINYYLRWKMADGSFISTSNIIQTQTITSPSNAIACQFALRNSIASGTFDFIKPQLYQLDSKEGTLNGVPKQLNKASKRQLYNKR